MADRRTIFLPLRTNVRYFASRRGFAALDARLKALALLYDDLLFENGVYDCSVGQNGAFDSLVPFMNDEQLKPRRSRRGAPMGINMQNERTGEWFPVMATRSLKAFRAQFISTLDDLVAIKPTWAHYVSFNPGIPGYRDVEAASKLASDWTWAERDLVKQALPDTPSFLRNKIHGNLNLDLARAAVMGIDFSPDALHEPLLLAKAAAAPLDVHATGERALRLVLPELASASWKDVAEIRRSPGLTALRHKLRELDAPALADATVLKRIHDEFLEEPDRQRPRWWRPGASGTLTAIGAIPIVGQVVGTVAGVAQTAMEVGQVWHGKRSWTATLIRARRQLRRDRP